MVTKWLKLQAYVYYFRTYGQKQAEISIKIDKLASEMYPKQKNKIQSRLKILVTNVNPGHLSLKNTRFCTRSNPEVECVIFAKNRNVREQKIVQVIQFNKCANESINVYSVNARRLMSFLVTS